MLLLNYNMLYGFSAEDLSPVPELTSGCEPNSDYMEWTCPIRDDVTWHDGEPLTAEDIAFTVPVHPRQRASTRSPTTCRSTPRSRRPDPYRWSGSRGSRPSRRRFRLTSRSCPSTSGVRSTAGPRRRSGRSRRSRRSARDRSSSRSGRRGSSGGWRRSKATSSATPRSTRSSTTSTATMRRWSRPCDRARSTTRTTSRRPSRTAWRATTTSRSSTRRPTTTEPGVQLRRPGRWPTRSSTARHRRRSRRTIRPSTTTPSGSRSRTRSTSRRWPTPSSRVRRCRRTRSSHPTRRTGISTSRRRRNTPSTSTRPTGSSTTPGYGTQRRRDPDRPGEREPLVLDILTIDNSRGSNKSGELMAGWMEEIGIRVRRPPGQRDEGVRGVGERDVRRLHLELGRRPDPGLQHVDHTSDQCLGGAMAATSNPSSTSSTRSSGRRSTVRHGRRSSRFQRIHYEEMPEIALVYPELIHAYRNDTFGGIRELADGRRCPDLRVASRLVHEPQARDGGGWGAGGGRGRHVDRTAGRDRRRRRARRSSRSW